MNICQQMKNIAKTGSTIKFYEHSHGCGLDIENSVTKKCMIAEDRRIRETTSALKGGPPIREFDLFATSYSKTGIGWPATDEEGELISEGEFNIDFPVCKGEGEPVHFKLQELGCEGEDIHYHMGVEHTHARCPYNGFQKVFNLVDKHRRGKLPLTPR